MISFDHDTGGGYIAMPTTLTGDEQLQQLTMTIKSEEKDGLIFYVADDPVGTHSLSLALLHLSLSSRTSAEACLTGWPNVQPQGWVMCGVASLTVFVKYSCYATLLFS